MIASLNVVLAASLTTEARYRTAIRLLEHGERRAIGLRAILMSHHANSRLLRRTIRGLGGVPTETTSAWGLWSRAAESLSGLLGAVPMVRALKRGEAQGSRRAEEALRRLDPSTRSLVSRPVLGRLQEHQRLLAALLVPA